MSLNASALARVRKGFEDLQRITQSQEVDLARVEERVKGLQSLIDEVKESIRILDVEVTDLGKDLSAFRSEVQALKPLMSSGEWIAPALQGQEKKGKSNSNKYVVWLAIISMLTAIGTATVQVVPAIIDALEPGVEDGKVKKP